MTTEKDKILYTCSLCYNKLDGINYSPMILPECNHALCSSCISNILINNKILKCPIDNKTYPNIKSISQLELKKNIEKQKNFKNNINISGLEDDSVDKEEYKNDILANDPFTHTRQNYYLNASLSTNSENNLKISNDS